MENRKKIGKLIISIILILCFPILLNWLLRISITSVIGGMDSDIVWLGFWANYGGAILGGLISLYILEKTIYYNKLESQKDRNYNLNRFLYEQKKSDLDKETERLTLYLQIYDFNRLKFVYNLRLKEKAGTNESLHMLGNVYSLAFERFNQFSVYYTDEEISSNSFLRQQGENYLSLIRLLDDFQILISINPDNWNNKDLQINNIQWYVREKGLKEHKLRKVVDRKFVNKFNLLDDLFGEYDDICQEKILTQIRDYINQKKIKIENSFINAYEETENGKP